MWRSLTLLAVVTVLAACRTTPKGITPVNGFDAERYTGTWHEIARLDHVFERGLTHVTAGYSLRDDGAIRVVNRGWDTKRRKWSEAEGVARFTGDADVAALSVTFQWPFSGGYNVIALDREGYQWALVCGPNRDYLWILAREKTLPEEVTAQLLAIAREKGFPVEELIWVEQDPPPPAG